MSVFTEPGFYLRAPDSGVEAVDFKALKAAGFPSLAVNVRDHEPAEWSVISTRASFARLSVLPWARCYTDDDVRALCAHARKSPSRAVIVNAEGELLAGKIDPELIVSETAGLDACVCTEPWVGELSLKVFKEIEIHLGLFPQETAWLNEPDKIRQCRAHAYDAGAHRVSFMNGVHGLHSESFPPLQAPFWIYTLDDCQTSWKEWTPKTIAPLTVPFTGPLYGPSSSKHTTEPTGTAKGLKITLHNAGFGNFSKPDRAYNRQLERAMRNMQRFAGITPWSGAYGQRSYDYLRRLASVSPGGTFALDPQAEALIRQDLS